MINLGIDDGVFSKETPSLKSETRSNTKKLEGPMT